MKPTALFATLSLSLSLFLAAGPTRAQEFAPDGDAEAGGVVFQDLCATCHGADARGAGPMASVLSIEPANLTELSQRNDGIFPLESAVRQIDGRDPLLVHGGPMPIFGNDLEGPGAALKTPSGQPILTSQPIVDLVTWLYQQQEN
ncbi:MAG: c-type cytochrome [Pseudomonadota bacterium]